MSKCITVIFRADTPDEQAIVDDAMSQPNLIGASITNELTRLELIEQALEVGDSILALEYVSAREVESLSHALT